MILLLLKRLWAWSARASARLGISALQWAGVEEKRLPKAWDRDFYTWTKAYVETVECTENNFCRRPRRMLSMNNEPTGAEGQSK